MKQNVSRAALVFCFSIALMSCGSIAAAGPDLPALIASPEPQAMAQLRQVLVEANHGAPVTIADDAFSNSSQLALEQGRLADGPARPLTGRDLGKPKIFRLVKNNSGCWLIRAEDSARWHLDKLSCIPE